ncbi:MAG: c-type cytochrome [Tagaea sp.]|nr:c-type cytochrome [Azospirillum sp.]MCA3267570.1 c-type cytochrome [Azospirillum sp.]MCZ8122459.1 c-type cytochrome [Magnetospirillum sp.]
MSKFFSALLALLIAGGAYAQERFPGIGRPATRAEVQAWDIDVRPDFQGLPRGKGTVAQGEEIWEAKCASCHGTFGEANHTFSPIVGGTTARDMETGRVANLRRQDYPQRTTFMKAPSVATLYDYIRRAMPWTNPKSLSDDEVYAVLAYMLNLADIVPAEFELNERTIRDVQNRMPNRNGMTTDHAMWPGRGFGTERNKPDTRGPACMTDCRLEARIASSLPDHARNAHGNLLLQNRVIGPVRGVPTAPGDFDFDDAETGPMLLARESGCLACHGVAQKIVGPGFAEVALRYRNQDVAEALAGRVRQGAQGVWGNVPMPPQPDLKDDEIRALVGWILAGAPEK